MAGNLDPIYSRVGDIQAGYAVLGPTANTAQDGSGAAMYQVFQADAVNGGFLQRLRFRAVGTTAATVVRVFICSNTAGSFVGGTTNLASNTTLFDEATLVLTTLSNTTSSIPADISFNIALPPGYRVLVAFGTSTGTAGNGWVVTAVGGKY